MTAPVTVKVYAADGSGAGTTLSDAAGVEWLDELNGPGLGKVKVPFTSSEAALLTYDAVVRCEYEGAARFAWFVEGRERDVVDEAGSRWVSCSGRGLLAWLEAATVYPVGGMTFSSPTVRWFNFSSTDSFDHDLGATWSTPVGVRWDARSDGVAGYPQDWPDPAALWLWSTNPQATATPMSSNWFRKAFSVAADCNAQVWATADDAFDLYVDGELVLSGALGVSSWHRFGSADIALAAGDHVIAIRGMNGWPNPSSYNPASVLAEVVSVDQFSGEPTALIVRTDTTWEVTADEPLWTAGDCLYTLVTEAQARGAGHLADLTLDFDAALDSDGNPWTTPVRRSWNVAKDTLLTVALDLCELGIDVWVTPDLVLHAVEQRGADVSGSVVLDDASTVTGWKVSGRRATGTHAWVRTDLGWIESVDTAGETAHGRLEVGLDAGNADSDDSAAQAATAAFVIMAQPDEVINDTTLVPASGAQPYVNFDVADTLSGLDGDGAPADCRVLSLTVTQDDNGRVTVKPELEVVT